MSQHLRGNPVKRWKRSARDDASMQDSPRRKRNLKRLFAPRHVAFIGGDDADYAARQCAAHFDGAVWGVNPGRREMGGQPCFRVVGDLPEAPDAVFLATPKSESVGIVRALGMMGAGAVVCFTAGYSETGEAGALAEADLVEAAGDMALVGPNCYGVINHVRQATLWPFGAGSGHCARGAALIMQSGMITADMSMNQRSVPLSFIVSAGNQAALAIEDYLDVLVDDPAVSAFGLYVEGIRDADRFARAAVKALRANKPIVVLKAGSSDIGARLAISHTGSMAGSDEAHEAFFERLGIIRVHAPELMLELLKFITVSGIPRGNRLAAFTCSGGESLLVADYGERTGVEFPQPSEPVGKKLQDLLPEIATVSNPLDYTTPLWGNTQIMPTVFSTLLEDEYDAAVFIQDYPPDGFPADASLYRADGRSFIAAVQRAEIPAAICSELSENFDPVSRKMCIESDVTPLQGLDRGIEAIYLASRYHANRSRVLQRNQPERLVRIQVRDKVVTRYSEWEAKRMCAGSGIRIPHGRYLDPEQVGQAVAAAREIGYPVVIKVVGRRIAHKTEQNLVEVGLGCDREVEEAVAALDRAIRLAGIPADSHGLLVEQMIRPVVHELMVSIRADVQFGHLMMIASGGVHVEIFRDSITMLLPVCGNDIKDALSRLRCFPLLTGYRGKDACDLDRLAGTILAVARLAGKLSPALLELEINPLAVTREDAYAIDALLVSRGGIQLRGIA